MFRIWCLGFRVLLLFELVLLASCATARYESYPTVTYAVASWYGPDFHGKQTASGDIFDMYAYTCAHRGYPFGTKLRVTNISNNKTVTCVVNDRGPFVSGRDLDLSFVAAQEIDLIGPGTCRVKIEYMGRNTLYMRKVRDLSDGGPFAIQVGSFRDLANAARLKRALELKYNRVYIRETSIDGDRFYRVRIGKLIIKGDAYRLGKELADEGYGVLIINYDERI